MYKLYVGKNFPVGLKIPRFTYTGLLLYNTCILWRCIFNSGKYSKILFEREFYRSVHRPLFESLCSNCSVNEPLMILGQGIFAVCSRLSGLKTCSSYSFARFFHILFLFLEKMWTRSIGMFFSLNAVKLVAYSRLDLLQKHPETSWPNDGGLENSLLTLTLKYPVRVPVQKQKELNFRIGIVKFNITPLVMRIVHCIFYNKLNKEYLPWLPARHSNPTASTSFFFRFEIIKIWIYCCYSAVDKK